ncbi:hypothetical protein JZU46_05610 [bacterium]|nr:hypothetical protein [bacterium]
MLLIKEKTPTETQEADAPPLRPVKKVAGTNQFQRFVQEATGRLLPIYGHDLFDSPQAYAATLLNLRQASSKPKLSSTPCAAKWPRPKKKNPPALVKVITLPNTVPTSTTKPCLSCKPNSMTWPV